MPSTSANAPSPAKRPAQKLLFARVAVYAAALVSTFSEFLPSAAPASGTCCALAEPAALPLVRLVDFASREPVDFLAVEWEEPLVEAERCELVPVAALLPDFAVEAESFTRLAEWWVVAPELEPDFRGVLEA